MNRILAVALALTIPTVLNAQTIEACYVKNTGTMYRVNAPNSPTKCSNNHLPFSWNEVGPQGAQGPVGPQGPQGPQGPAGTPGVLGYQMKAGVGVLIPPGAVQTRTVYCEAGKVVLGGGFHTQGQHDDLVTVFSGPSTNSIGLWGWQVRVRNTSGSQSVALGVYAMCAQAAS